MIYIGYTIGCIQLPAYRLYFLIKILYKYSLIVLVSFLKEIPILQNGCLRVPLCIWFLSYIPGE